MQQPQFREILAQEFKARREKNPRYSLRAFAAALGAVFCASELGSG
jgi:hypothetical protein